MSTPSVSLGYVILYVDDVAASMNFYEKAFGLSRHFFTGSGENAYGDMETGTTRLGFATIAMEKASVKQDVISASLNKPPLAAEIAFTTADVPALFARAVKAGATPVSEPEVKPWGQTVAYVRDNSGHLVEICTPIP